MTDSQDHELLIRIDERVLVIQFDISQLKADVTALRNTQTRYDPEQFVPRFSRTTKEWEEFKTTRAAERRIYIAIAAAIGSVITLLLAPIAESLVRLILN